MVFNVPDSGLALESSAKAMAGLPMQAFAITLSDSVIENMIECVQNGQGIQLSLGSSPVRHLRTFTRSFRSIYNTAHWPQK
jgi:RNA polymerase II elongation factor ELL